MQPATGEFSLAFERILDDDNFLRATFSGQHPRHLDSPPYQKVLLRPVLLKNERFIQFVCYTQTQSFTYNYRGEELTENLHRLFEMPFKNILIQSRSGDLQLNFNKKGKLQVHHHAPTSSGDEELRLAHDRAKPRLVSADTSEAYLRAIGIMSADGKIKAEMQSKYRQINQFVKFIDEVLPERLRLQQDSPLSIVDCGCGNAYLTFATYHYFAGVLQQPVNMTGIDIKGDLLQSHATKSAALGWSNLNFVPVHIQDFVPQNPPALVIALHACDTASDEALAQAVLWQSDLILCAPCCHHHLQAQIARTEPELAFAPVVKHGILKERLGDILTDALRAQILQIMGYRTQVIEFISSDHTPKNLLIRAVRQPALPLQAETVQAYEALKAYWQVTPYLETLLGERLASRLNEAMPVVPGL